MKTVSIPCLFILLLTMLACTSSKSPLLLTGTAPTMVSDEFSFTEGPTVAPDGDVYFTDQPNNRIYRWSAETETISLYMEDAGRANGLYFDKKGNLLACADENFQLWRIDQNQEVEVLVDGFEQQNLNGPNDLWVDKKGGIYFTDPYYQREYWTRQAPDMDRQRVYYRSPDGHTKVVADHFVRPNGIIGSPKDKTLYIADIGDQKTYRYDIHKNGSLSEPTLFVNMGSDGMTMDENGNIYLTGNGVTIFNPDGEQIGQIPIPQKWTANVTFGGKDRKTLFITAGPAVYTLKLNVSGTK
ncbi:SMP-30/gluconolactonase/LRE family protein [Echinicola vietnamensis]|uniref:Gluconolactonase n=1 Tax=Echinicola vietnamensis (strain DSM 17526 / LMG 23754 / KMM 6221) TaxID=926556 RepID=L0FRR7_ECHVK|nr:SMP-30/gluconolactonase/LRE family protein [Echinicola vietnamensis]AGA76614.1 gluconolactonase [Echinicola vietnamensis DSM 17526]